MDGEKKSKGEIKMKFPKTLYVVINKNQDGSETLELEQYTEAEDGQIVAKYDLVQKRKMQITKELV